MSKIAENPRTDVTLRAESFDGAGTPVGLDEEVTIVVQAKREAQAWLQSKQWVLLWRDADILYQSPRPLSTWENTYIQEPNVTRFTVLKLCNAIASTMSKGLFYEDPPVLLRPRPGTKPDVVTWKTAVMGTLLRRMDFKREIDLGIDQFSLLGTTVFKWTVNKERICVPTRKASTKQVAGEAVTVDQEPQVTDVYKTVCCPRIEMLDIAGDVVEGQGGSVLVDPKCAVPDIRCANWVVYRDFVSYYDVQKLALNPDYFGLRPDDSKLDEKGNVPTDADGFAILAADVKGWWIAPAPETDSTDGISGAQGNVVHHAAAPTDPSSNPLENRLEILEYLNQKTSKVITVLNEKKVIRRGDANGKIGYLSANFYNRRKAWLGMGVGLIAGQDQRVEQGTLNSALKVLSMNMNTGYAMEQGGGQPTGMIRTGLGKIYTVNDIAKMPKLIDTVKVDPSIWQVLAESRMQSESTTGADQMLVQGSSGGPRSSITRTKGGANLMASASATRLEGPLGRLIEQVIVPFFYILDEIIFRHVSDQEILDILGERLGKEALDGVDMQRYHDSKCEFDVLAGAALAAKQTMAQSLVIIGEYMLNPQLQQFMAEVHGVYMDQLEFMKMVLTASDWGQGVAETLIKPMTPEMKQRMQEKQQAQDPKLAGQLVRDRQKYEAQSALEDLKTKDRITKDIAVDAFRQAGEAEAVLGQPSGPGFGQPAEGVEA